MSPRRGGRSRSLSAVAVFCLIALWVGDEARADTDWTIMVYMNGKNSLESYAVQNYLDIAKVQSSDQINVLVELGRPETPTNSGRTPKDWGGVRRYKMKNGMDLTSAPLIDLGSRGAATDMGVPATLQDFIQWSIDHFKAQHYALIISSHGQGYRLELQSADENPRGPAPSINNSLIPPTLGGYRSVSMDDDSHNTLYNRQIEEVLNSFAANGVKIDVLGFDACSMGMIETAFAMRHGANYMIASEEVEPDEGWDYSAFLNSFIRLVNADASQNAARSGEAMALGSLIVSKYHDQQGEGESRTLSLIDLSKLDSLSVNVSAFAKALENSLTKQRAAIDRARESDRWFGMAVKLSNTSVDLPYLLTRFAQETDDPGLKTLALSTRASARDSIVTYYVSKYAVTQNLGGEGLAIFFPPTCIDFLRDPDSSGYMRGNRSEPIEFVESNEWSLFLAAYLGLPASRCD
jgi:hypothetical protein